MLNHLLVGRALKVVDLEAKGPWEAVAHIDHEGKLRAVTAEVSDEKAGQWVKDADLYHPQRLAFPGAFPLPASKVDSIKNSFLYVNFAPDGRSAILMRGEDVVGVVKRSELRRPSPTGGEPVYVVPLGLCLVIHAGGSTPASCAD
jgi:hypothetical protein